MTFEFLKELMEMQVPSNKHPLLNNEEFNTLAKTAPHFADKLVTAWNGDTHEYKRLHGKAADLLFPRMVKNITKYVPDLTITPQLQRALNDLVRLHASTFPTLAQPTKQDTSVWQHEPWARESTEFNIANYVLLCEELENLLKN